MEGRRDAALFTAAAAGSAATRLLHRRGPINTGRLPVDRSSMNAGRYKDRRDNLIPDDIMCFSNDTPAVVLA